MGRVQTNLATIRKARGVGASELAKKVGVTRQTIYAIEAGTYVPNTEVTLRLARELEVTVEELFSLPGERAARDDCGHCRIPGTTALRRMGRL